MCDMTIEDESGNAANADECSGNLVRRGDLLVCTTHAQSIPWNVGRVPGEVRCRICGGFREVGQECGEPCSF